MDQMVGTTIFLLRVGVKSIVEECAASTLKRQAVPILIADDYGGVRQFLGEALQAQGYHVRLASNGREALALFVETSADLIITDYEMPYLDGISLAKRAKALRPETVVILLTGHEDLARITAEAVTAGIQEIIQKTSDLSAVVEKVDEIFRKKNSET